ncbi:MAG: hypothetical protein KDC91_05060, partial [Flavobacteriaceae bacterium]|nr:hypothetical protein [Flavobacteriaceae bacterium]
GKLLKGLVSASKFKASLKFVEFEVDGEKIANNLTEGKDKTFIELKEEFKVEFRRWEDNVTKGKNPKFNLIFIDDLDRCEPENVLNLLSALKLFFTYGQKTIFFCGIDEKAINEAVKTKYGDVVKSSEYLEKVFDISFKMPLTANKLKLYSQYFSSETLYPFKKSDMPLPQIIDLFFYELNFTNPRRIKKVLNRFLIVKNIIGNLDKKSHLNEHYGKITNDDEICLFDLFFTLYFILLRLFYPVIIENIENDSLRILNYETAVSNQKGITESGIRSSKTSFRRIFKDRSLEISFITFNQIVGTHVNQDKEIFYDRISKFLIKLAPINPSIFNPSAFNTSENYTELFILEKKGIDYFFVLFLLNNFKSLGIQKIKSDKSVSQMLYLIKSIP